MLVSVKADDWSQLPNGSGDGRRKKNKSGEDCTTELLKLAMETDEEFQSKTEEDGSNHTAEVIPGDRGRKKS